MDDRVEGQPGVVDRVALVDLVPEGVGRTEPVEGLVGCLVLQGIAFVVAVSAGPEALEGGLGLLTWLRLAVGIVLPLVAAGLAIAASSAASLQASTGLLYIGLALVMAGSIAGASIAYLTGVPV